MTSLAFNEIAQGDGDELLDRGGVAAQGRLDIDVDPEAGKDASRAPVRLAPSDQPAPAPGLVAHRHVFRHAAQRDEVQFLIDSRDAALLGLTRAGDIRGRPVEPDVAPVAPIDTGQDLDQRGLAGTVLSDQGMNLARPDLEAGGCERRHARKRLVHARHRQFRGHGTRASHKRSGTAVAVPPSEAREGRISKRCRYAWQRFPG